ETIKAGSAVVTAVETEDGKVETVIKCSSGDSLPSNIMTSLKNSEDVSLVFTYAYEGVDYKVEITSEEAELFFDPEIKWYGPLWLHAHFSEEARAARKALKEAESVKGTYEIKAGDTLRAIARRLGTTVEALVKKNGIKNPNEIKAGQKLNY
ncbi:MAG: LysM peptidoglycan-binding domain-containing protein, partial [Lachnospiraceae bacterium]|nr:LysM peptidoglycan-binding domain-containing protein [Lachnospiraceae bacterium]